MKFAKTVFTTISFSFAAAAVILIVVSTASAAGLTLLGDSPSALKFYAACYDYGPAIFLLSFGSVFLTGLFLLLGYLSNPERKPITFNL